MAGFRGAQVSGCRCQGCTLDVWEHKFFCIYLSCSICKHRFACPSMVSIVRLIISVDHNCVIPPSGCCRRLLLKPFAESVLLEPNLDGLLRSLLKAKTGKKTQHKLATGEPEVPRACGCTNGSLLRSLVECKKHHRLGLAALS